jgi:hypothetical protein
MLSIFGRLFGTSAEPVTAPTEFVIQVLEPTGGKISRPKDWFYSEGHRGPVFEWLLTRENVSGKCPYTTGVRIQGFPHVLKNTGKTAKQFVLDIEARKRKEASRIVSTFDEMNQGMFTRIGLETEEGPHHILYSLFWGSGGMDLAIVVIAGTTKELWGTFAATFDRMNDFELIDMKRYSP